MEFVLQTQNLCKKYGKFNALSDLSINIPKGAIYGMVGRNGAGKTTLIRIITGLNNPTSGEYSIFGVKNNDKKLLEVKRKMGAVVETPSLHPDMSARDNLIQQTKALGISNDKIDELLKLVGLANTGKKKAKDFSLGMRQRLGIAFSLVPSAMWPSVPKIIPMKQLGSAYAIIFYIQNIGLSMVPVLIGNVIASNTANGTTDYTMPMSIFALFGAIAVVISVTLKIVDKKNGYGLEEKNMK